LDLLALDHLRMLLFSLKQFDSVLIGLYVWLVASKYKHVSAESHLHHIIIVKENIFSSLVTYYESIVFAVIEKF